MFCPKPSQSVCSVLLILTLHNPPGKPWQVQETLGLVGFLYGLETIAVTAVLLPNKGLSWNFGINDWWGFRQLHTDMSGHQCHASGLWQEKEN